MRMKLTAESGSQDEPYVVIFQYYRGKLSASCSCMGGMHGKLCKHIIAFLSGDDSMLYDKTQKVYLDKLAKYVQRTGVPDLLSIWQNAEKMGKQENAKRAKKKLQQAVVRAELVWGKEFLKEHGMKEHGNGTSSLTFLKISVGDGQKSLKGHGR